MANPDTIDPADLDRQRIAAIHAAAELHEVADPGLIDALVVRGVEAAKADPLIEAFANGRPAQLPDGTTFFPPELGG